MSNKAIHSKDSYKIDHIKQYPVGISEVYSNLTARSGAHSNVPTDGVVFVGMSMFLQDYLDREWNETFFLADKDRVLLNYARRVKGIIGRDIDVSHIAALHDLGYLPVEIKALPEGTFVPYRVPMLTIKNTYDKDNRFAWVTNMLECVLSNELWGPTTTATTYTAFRKLFVKYAVETGSPIEFTAYQGHDFSYRGMYGRHAAAQSGLAVLLAGGQGTDNIPAIDLAEEFYHARSDKEVVGESISATEHSVVCANGSEDEYSTILRLLTEVYPDGNFSYVSDTWDFWKVVTEYLPRLRDVIISRDGKFVVRPDSGNPYDILCGVDIFDDETDSDDVWDFIYNANDGDLFRCNGVIYEVNGLEDLRDEYGTDTLYDCVGNTLKSLLGSGYAGKLRTPLTEVEEKGLIQILYEIFGGTETSKGYKVLDEHIGVIYGDGITYPLAEAILSRLAKKGFASCNIVFGLGSYLFQYVTRDTHGIAMKATSVVVNGERDAIQKTPKTDSGTKRSAKGYLKVERVDGKLVLFEDVLEDEEKEGLLETVFINSRLAPTPTLEDVRGRVQVNYATRFIDGELKVA